MNKTIKWILVLALSLSVGAGIGYAATSWTQNIGWTIQNKSFTVTGETTLNYGIIEMPSTKLENYTVTNTGNVAITVNAAAVAAGATVSWNQTSATIQPAATSTYQLTLTINATGNCTVTFTLGA